MTAILLAGAVLWWAVALAWVVGFERGRTPAALGHQSVHLGCGWLTLVPAWLALIHLHAEGDRGPAAVLLLLVLVWVADIAAFFVGRRFGRRRLAARVSPGKSWEGALGGVAAAALVAAIGGVLGRLDVVGVVLLAGLGLLAASVSVLGDLWESLVKRVAGVKDSGRLLPGHGGVLDRIDSLTAAAPVFVLGTWLGSGIA